MIHEEVSLVNVGTVIRRMGNHFHALYANTIISQNPEQEHGNRICDREDKTIQQQLISI